MDEIFRLAAYYFWWFCLAISGYFTVMLIAFKIWATGADLFGWMISGNEGDQPWWMMILEVNGESTTRLMLSILVFIMSYNQIYI